MLPTELPETKHLRFIEAAYEAAFLSPGAGRDTFRHGCVIVHKNTILMKAYNEFKTHPKCLLFSKWPFLHAETRAIINLGLTNCKKCDIYITRIMKNNHLGLSKPCPSCQKLIDYVGIKNCYYSTYEGYEKL